MKGMDWEPRYFAKLIITCCLIMVFQKDEEMIRETCIATRDILSIMDKDSLLEIVQNYTYHIAMMMQRVLTVRTRLTQAMILEVILRLTNNADKIRLHALEKQKFYKEMKVNDRKDVIAPFLIIKSDDVEKTSRGFLMAVNMIFSPQNGIHSIPGCIFKVNNFVNTEGDIVYFDFNARAQSISFTLPRRYICQALDTSNKYYTRGLVPTYFEAFFSSLILCKIDPGHKHNDIVVNVVHLMYKQDLNSPLEEIRDVHRLIITLVGDQIKFSNLKSFLDFYKPILCSGDPLHVEDCVKNIEDQQNESLLSFQTDVSFLDDSFSIDTSEIGASQTSTEVTASSSRISRQNSRRLSSSQRSSSQPNSQQFASQQKSQRSSSQPNSQRSGSASQSNSQRTASQASSQNSQGSSSQTSGPVKQKEGTLQHFENVPFAIFVDEEKKEPPQIQQSQESETDKVKEKVAKPPKKPKPSLLDTLMEVTETSQISKFLTDDIEMAECKSKSLVIPDDIDMKEAPVGECARCDVEMIDDKVPSDDIDMADNIANPEVHDIEMPVIETPYFEHLEELPEAPCMNLDFREHETDIEMKEECLNNRKKVIIF